jgi:hypothetical protein
MDDLRYIRLVFGGLLISILTIIGLALAAWKEKPPTRPSAHS